MTKSGTRRKSRELTLQMLFQLDMGKQNVDQVRTTFWRERKDLDDKVREFADELFRIASERGEEIRHDLAAFYPCRIPAVRLAGARYVESTDAPLYLRGMARLERDVDQQREVWLAGNVAVAIEKPALEILLLLRRVARHRGREERRCYERVLRRVRFTCV